MKRLYRLLLMLIALAGAFFINWIIVKAENGLLLYLVLVSSASFGVHVLDKRKAIAGKMRLAEWQLLIFDILGGWVGGLVARGLVGYSSLKNGFRGRFAIVVVLNITCVLSAAWINPDLVLA